LAGVPRGHRARLRGTRPGGGARTELIPRRYVRPPPVCLLAPLPRCEAGRAGTSRNAVPHRSPPTRSPPDAHPAKESSAVMDDRDQRSRDAADAVHVPVLLERVLTLLAPALADRPAVAVDATLGLGGHAAALLA